MISLGHKVRQSLGDLCFGIRERFATGTGTIAFLSKRCFFLNMMDTTGYCENFFVVNELSKTASLLVLVNISYVPIHLNLLTSPL